MSEANKRLIVLLSVVGALVLGYLLGARYFETGNAGLKKGANVLVTGLCTVMGDVRYPPLKENEVKITKVTEKYIQGVVRSTTEPVECDLSLTSVEAIPPLSKILRTPAPFAKEAPGTLIKKEVKQEDEKYHLLSSEVLVTGECRDSKSESKIVSDRVGEVIDAKKDPSQKWVVTVVFKDRKEIADCSESRANIRKKTQEQVQGIMTAEAAEKSYINKTLLVTGDCSEYRSPLDDRDRSIKRVFVPLTDGPVKVRTNTFVEGKLVKFTGYYIDENILVECDIGKNPEITVRPFDPTTQRLVNPNKDKKRNQ